MNSTLSPPSFCLQIHLPSRHSSPRCPLQPLQYNFTSTPNPLLNRSSGSSLRRLSSPLNSLCSLLHTRKPSVASASVEEGPVSVIDFQEKDWSFLDSDELNSTQKIGRIISAGGVEESSRVLVSIGSEPFVDQLVDTSPRSFFLAVHESLFMLAGIKAKYEDVKCWQGELIHVPEKWVPFDVVFLYFLPALPFNLDQVFGSLAERCSPGARVVISHPEGRKMLEQQRIQYGDAVVSDLPDKMTLQKVAGDHAFEMVEFEDDPEFYLAVLRFPKA